MEKAGLLQAGVGIAEVAFVSYITLENGSEFLSLKSIVSYATINFGGANLLCGLFRAKGPNDDHFFDTTYWTFETKIASSLVGIVRKNYDKLTNYAGW